MAKKENVVAASNATYTIPINSGGGVTNINYDFSSNTNFSNNNGKAVMSIPYNENKVIIDESAALEVKGRMVINGIDLEERLSTIEKLLNIPTRDAKLEAKYSKLQDLYEQYTTALEEYRTWEKIKEAK